MRSFFTATAVWIFLSAVGFAVADLVIMPLIAGHFKGTVEIPDVVGLHPEDAETMLKDFNLVYMMDSVGQYSPEIKAGLILSQRPSARTEVKRNRRVWVTISKGLKSIKLPKLMGNSVRQVEILLQQMSLRVGRVLEVANPDIPAGVVYKTNPPEGSIIEVNSKVAVYVSSGPQEKFSLVKNMIGMPMTRANAWVKRMRMKLGEVEYLEESSVLPNTVLDQTPKPGSPILSGGVINLIVSKK